MVMYNPIKKCRKKIVYTNWIRSAICLEIFYDVELQVG